jgi:hypothetical protein
MRKNVIETEKAWVSLTTQGHVLTRIKEQMDLEVRDIEEMLAAKRSLIGDREHTVLFVSPRFGTITPEAREFSASSEVGYKVIARAIVTSSLSSRLLGNFYMRINRPTTPTKLFENEEDASKWLDKVLEKGKVVG